MVKILIGFEIVISPVSTSLPVSDSPCVIALVHGYSWEDKDLTQQDWLHAPSDASIFHESRARQRLPVCLIGSHKTESIA